MSYFAAKQGKNERIYVQRTSSNNVAHMRAVKNAHEFEQRVLLYRFVEMIDNEKQHK